MLFHARPASDHELAAQLLVVDVTALIDLLYFSGGSANPFVSLFLLPPTIAAALTARHAWFVASTTVAPHTAF